MKVDWSWRINTDLPRKIPRAMRCVAMRRQRSSENRWELLQTTKIRQNESYDLLDKVKFDEIKTHSFIAKESKLLSYVNDRNAVDINKAEMDFDIYTKDVFERQVRTDKLKRLYERKLRNLEAFQNGKDLWKSRFQSHIAETY